jgi:Ethanolamine ammonia-lyase light chain (EutC)
MHRATIGNERYIFPDPVTLLAKASPPRSGDVLAGIAAHNCRPTAGASRVAIGDAVAQLLRARMVVVLIGERPGLSAPDSMGAYLTWEPGPRTTDADRNCISNIRPEGIDPAGAAFKLLHLLRAMRTRRMSGVALRDDTERLAIAGSGQVQA